MMAPEAGPDRLNMKFTELRQKSGHSSCARSPAKNKQRQKDNHDYVSRAASDPQQDSYEN